MNCCCCCAGYVAAVGGRHCHCFRPAGGAIEHSGGRGCWILPLGDEGDGVAVVVAGRAAGAGDGRVDVD